jgi:hypothetical protein
MFYTYAHTKPDGSIFYIGKGAGVRAWKKTPRNQHWKNIVAKYKNYNVEILANWENEQEAFDHEVLLISCFRDMGYTLANMTTGGEGTSGLILTKEHKQKIGNAQRGAKNWCFGKPKTKEHKTKISVTKQAQKLLGAKCINFKCSIAATNIKTGAEIILSGTSEMHAAGFQNSNVFKCLNGKRKSHKGHTFKRLQI